MIEISNKAMFITGEPRESVSPVSNTSDELIGVYKGVRPGSGNSKYGIISEKTYKRNMLQFIIFNQLFN